MSTSRVIRSSTEAVGHRLGVTPALGQFAGFARPAGLVLEAVGVALSP
jgi:hypothetical protein